MKRILSFFMVLIIALSYAIPAECRMYDPKIGRFLQRDPIGYVDGPNPYTYVHNNPINYIDPYGELAIADDLAFLILVGIGVTAYYGLKYYYENMPSSYPSWSFPNTGSNSNTCPIQYQSDRTPAKGEPNSSDVFEDGDSVTERFYGEEGDADVDIDYGHDHNKSGDPHYHEWDWTKNKDPRGPGKKLP